MGMSYLPDVKRYDEAVFRRCGRSGIVLPPVSLGLWQNFGGVDVFETGRAVIRRAFDRGVTHFDLANNYGPPYGSAEENFGHILRKDFRDHRNELLISSKAAPRTLSERGYVDNINPAAQLQGTYEGSVDSCLLFNTGGASCACQRQGETGFRGGGDDGD